MYIDWAIHTKRTVYIHILYLFIAFLNLSTLVPHFRNYFCYQFTVVGHGHITWQWSIALPAFKHWQAIWLVTWKRPPNRQKSVHSVLAIVYLLIKPKWCRAGLVMFLYSACSKRFKKKWTISKHHVHFIIQKDQNNHIVKYLSQVSLQNTKKGEERYLFIKTTLPERGRAILGVSKDLSGLQHRDPTAQTQHTRHIFNVATWYKFKSKKAPHNTTHSRGDFCHTQMSSPTKFKANVMCKKFEKHQPDTLLSI